MGIVEMKGYARQDANDDLLSQQIVDAAFQVHSALGPGLLESIYEACLIQELKERGLTVESQKSLPVYYKGKKIEAAFKCDLFINENIIVELKAVDAILPVHEAQLLTYMKLADKRLGFVINFNTVLIKDGIKRMVRRK
jgi:GxxExxY protein